MEKIQKLLVANRGEIAIRILRAASELGIRTITVFTYEDRYSLHRFKADEAYQIGNDDDPLKPYLDIDELIRVAKQHQVQAITRDMASCQKTLTWQKDVQMKD